eukprot:CCRYP_010763-RA/>CCRYP_010763-RA protein AED:0.20 eAED:0.59 QI:0/0/0.5/1/0/0/2/247/204
MALLAVGLAFGVGEESNFLQFRLESLDSLRLFGDGDFGFVGLGFVQTGSGGVVGVTVVGGKIVTAVGGSRGIQTGRGTARRKPGVALPSQTAQHDILDGIFVAVGFFLEGLVVVVAQCPIGNVAGCFPEGFAFLAVVHFLLFYGVGGNGMGQGPVYFGKGWCDCLRSVGSNRNPTNLEKRRSDQRDKRSGQAGIISTFDGGVSQ